jgi:hypothetical protein
VASPARGLLDAVGALHAAALRECRHVFVTPGRSGAGPAQIAGITALRLDAPPCGADQEVDRDREGWSAVVRRLLS